MERMHWLNFKGHAILVGDYSHITDPEEYRQIIETITRESEVAIRQRFTKPDHAALMLIDIQGSLISTVVVQAFKANARRIEPLTRKIAVLGVIGVRKVFLDSVLRFSRINGKAMDSREAAMQWLVSED